MANNNNFDSVYPRRVALSNEQLDRYASDVKRRLGVEVQGIQEIEDGYLFKGKFGVVIGDLTYDYHQGLYKRFNYHQGAIENIANEERRRRSQPQPQPQPQKAQQPQTTYRRRARKFKLQKGKRIGIALGATALAVLISIGAIAVKTNAVETHKIPSYNMEQVNTVASANDLILNSWANYAIGEVIDGANSSDYQYAQSVAEDLRNNYYNKMMLSYYNYVDQIDSGLPDDIIGKLKDSYHNEFRNQCYIFDEALENSFYDYVTFDESPYADAVVYDQNGNRVVSNGLYGESYDSNGSLIIPGGNIGYIVYVKAVDVPGNNYSITNLPSDTKFINGETYVSDEHLDDFVNINSKTK